MHSLSSKLRSLFKWRPQYWQDLMLLRFLWKVFHQNYDKLIQDGERLKSLLSLCVYDESTMKKAHHLHVSVSSSWYGIMVYGNSIQEIKHKRLQITPQERAICDAYRDTGFRIFYECRILYLDAQLLTGKITQDERDKSLDYAKKRYAYKCLTNPGSISDFVTEKKGLSATVSKNSQPS